MFLLRKLRSLAPRCFQFFLFFLGSKRLALGRGEPFALPLPLVFFLLLGQLECLLVFLGLQFAGDGCLRFKCSVGCGVAVVIAILGLFDVDAFFLRLFRPHQRHVKFIQRGVLGNNPHTVIDRVAQQRRADALGPARLVLPNFWPCLDGDRRPCWFRRCHWLNYRLSHRINQLHSRCGSRRWRREWIVWNGRRGRQWRRRCECLISLRDHHGQRRRCAGRTQPGYAKLQQENKCMQDERHQQAAKQSAVGTIGRTLPVLQQARLHATQLLR